MQDYWQRQSNNKPLFPDLQWSRPETKQSAGKLLIVGGNAFGFSAPGEAYNEAVQAGIGTARVLLPDSLQKTVGKVFAAGEYAPSTPSGSFSQRALAELLAMGEWADGILFAGDVGRNSETAIIIEQCLVKHSGQVTLTRDAADYIITTPQTALKRPETLLVISFAQLQKLGTAAKFTTAFTFDMDFLRLVEALHDFTTLHPIAIIVKHLQNIFVAYGGQVSSTKLEPDPEIWRVKAAAHASVWWLQTPAQTFAALSSSQLPPTA